MKKNEELKRYNQSVLENDLKKKLLAAHGVQIMDLGSTNETGFDEFYGNVFKDVREKIKASRT